MTAPPDQPHISLAQALLSSGLTGILGFFLGRVSTSLDKKGKRQQAARLTVHAARPIAESLRKNRDAFRDANQLGNQAVRGYFLMTLVPFSPDDGEEFEQQSRLLVDFPDTAVTDIRKASAGLVKLERRHSALRDTLDYGNKWKSEREPYLRLLEGTLSTVCAGVRALRPSVPRDSRALVDSVGEMGEG